MDLLRSLNVEELPEQQTRTLHLVQDNPGFDRSLGFDSCCTCGKKLGSSKDSITIACRACKRVNYCSESCRHEDANVTLFPEHYDNSDDNESAMGHTAVICSLLRLCQDDEDVENNISLSDPDRTKAARDRIQSEKESYPATLANAVFSGPCYQETLRRCATRKAIVFHIVGASNDAELWDYQDGADKEWEFVQAYADAMTDLAEKFHFEMIELIFIGLECPDSNMDRSVSLRSLRSNNPACNIVIRTLKGHYNKDLLIDNEVAKVDIVIFFNPGFTVPDYFWNESIDSIQNGTPFLLTTNTEMEGIADCQYLLDQDKIQSLPPGLAELFGLYCARDDPDTEAADDAQPFFGENPFCGNRVRQNGTMANDLFVKNHWMLGGIMDSYDPSKVNQAAPSKKQKQSSGESNTKQRNPALI